MYSEHMRIPIGTGALHVERVGRGGPAVVLLHGLGTCTFLWRRLAPVLAMDGYTAIAIDLLGHGESDRPEDGNFTVGAQAEHVARVLAALRLPSVRVVGQDIGALVALTLAANPRAHVESVALLSPPDPDDLPGPEIRALQRSAALLVFGANTLFGAQPALAQLLHGGVANAEHMPDRLVARYLAPFVGPDGLNQLLQRAAAVELTGDQRELLADVRGPVLVAIGEAEAPKPSLSWATLLPSASVAVTQIAGAGRLLPEDAPDAVETLILEWLGSQR